MAGFFKFFSNPVRLKILCVLSEKDLTVGQISEAVGQSKFYVSQELRAMKRAGIIAQRKEGLFVWNSIKNQKLLKELQRIDTLLSFDFSKEI